MRKACEDFEAELKEFTGARDHVHLLAHYPPKAAVSKLVNSLKGVSARRIRQEFTGRINHAVLWSPSYFSASCGKAPLAIIRHYTEQQQHPLQGARHSSLETHSSPA
ncbi:IS200/IS605 family transposase [Streptomyces daliensis]|uniref:IS200/IS605 family transposase n=1 Tax=Streptomyces daliensis TaxID=299421 RepID=A0A8T4IPD8_9ACTN|nr:IS200/IS605 family transposase [Streptomyces daliensis]